MLTPKKPAGLTNDSQSAAQFEAEEEEVLVSVGDGETVVDVTMLHSQRLL